MGNYLRGINWQQLPGKLKIDIIFLPEETKLQLYANIQRCPSQYYLKLNYLSHLPK